MPIYEYHCSKCGDFEAIQNFSDKPLKCRPDCPEKKCPKSAERLISAAAFHLKGTGWYKTDYATDKSAGAKGSAKGSKASKDSGDTDSSAGAATETPKADEFKSKPDKAGGESSSLKQAKKNCGPGCGCH